MAFNGSASQAGGDFTLGMAKDRANNSAVKSLLYGGDGGYVADERAKGKKSVSQAQSREAPFATNEPIGHGAGAPGGRLLASKSKLREQGAGKVGQTDFDPAIYSAAIASNAANMAASRRRNQAGSGVFGGHDEPAAGAPIGGGARPGQLVAPEEPAYVDEVAQEGMLHQTVAISEAGEMMSPSRPPVRAEGEELHFGQ